MQLAIGAADDGLGAGFVVLVGGIRIEQREAFLIDVDHRLAPKRTQKLAVLTLSFFMLSY